MTELQQLVQCISHRVGRHLERRGLLIRDAESAYLDWDGEQASPLDDLAGHSITYRIALRPHEGQKAFALPPVEPDDDGFSEVAEAGGFSLHAGVAARADQCDRLERLCRTLSRLVLASYYQVATSRLLG